MDNALTMDELERKALVTSRGRVSLIFLYITRQNAPIRKKRALT